MQLEGVNCENLISVVALLTTSSILTLWQKQATQVKLMQGRGEEWWLLHNLFFLTPDKTAHPADSQTMNGTQPQKKRLNPFCLPGGLHGVMKKL